MADRTEVTFAELGQIFDGPHATPQRIAEGPFFLNIASLNNGRLDLAQSDHVSSTQFTQWTRRVTPRENDLLFSYETKLGEAALMPAGVEACLGRRMALIRPDTGVVDPRFLLYLYLSPTVQRIIEANTIHGATVNRIALSTMSTWRVAVPDLHEQRAVGSLLGALDEKIAANGQLVRICEQLIFAMASSFSASIPLEDIANTARRTLNPGTLTDEAVAHFSLPAYDDTRGPEVVAPASIMSSKLLVDGPSVLISKLNPRFPRVWDVPAIPAETALASTEFVVLEPTVCSTTVLWSLLLQPAFGAALEGMAAGTSGSHQRVKPSEMLATLVADPRSIPEQVQEQITSIGARAHAARREFAALAALRDTLLPALMSGRLRVRDAERIVEDAT